MVKNVCSSKFLLFIIVLFAIFCSYRDKRWETGSIIQNDVLFYYGYLPATFIYHDLTFGFVRNLPGQIQAKIYTPLTEDNRVVQKMTCGVAVMLLPFFLIAHLYSLFFSLPANGYTSVYEFSIAVAALFYFTAGLIFLRKILKKFFNEGAVALTLFIIALCTNLFYYTTYESGMSHVYNFCLFSVFVWITIKWHENPSVTNSFLAGLILGMITLVRPTNCVAGIFFILYSVIDKKTFLQKLRTIKENFSRILIIASALFIPVLLQLMYWKFASGHWVYYSYGNQGFFFNNPHVWQGLFGFRKGFFIYAPVMLLIIPGCWLAWKEQRKFSLGVIVFFVVTVYIIFSWWCWWYGGSFGSRPMIDSFAVFALPLGTVVEKWLAGRLLKKMVLLLFILLTWVLNLFQSEQSKSTLLHWDGMNAQLYFKIFGSLSFPENYNLMVTPSDGESALKGLPERETFELTADWLKLLYTYKVNIKGGNQKFVCAEADHDGWIVCNRDQPFSWETFLMNRYYGDYCTLQSFQGKYVGITPENAFKANKLNAGRTEVFKIIDLGNNKFALKCLNGYYVTIDKEHADQLINGGLNIGENEIFEFNVFCDSSKNK